ncbi:MAG: flagellar biosynthetic protein FliR, partial [Candidatus Marinamargulisbacteria bacterium]|nr:flagellar biosynthetic protein FliR [Candidatus Marinamargulisbacteria bacterium]
MIIPIDYVIVVSLITARIFGLFITAPVFNSSQLMPGMVRVIMMILLSMLISFAVPLPDVIPAQPISLFLALVMEIVIGLCLGFTIQLLIVGIELAGSIIDTQAGISAASMFDPLRGDQVTIIARLYRQLILLVFLLLNGHHVVLLAIRTTFDVIPVGMANELITGDHFLYVVSLGSMMFEVGWRFSAPVIVIIFFVDFGFGMLSRIASQVNVFQLSFQLKPMVMILVLLLIIP